VPGFDRLLWSISFWIRRYGVAVLSAASALVISRWLHLHLGAPPGTMFICAVMLSAWYGGVGPALFATALSTFSFHYFFLPPIHTLALRPGEIPKLSMYMAANLIVGLLSAAQRNAKESLRRAGDDLSHTVQDLQRTNEALRRSEAYLAQAQRLSQTGSFGWNVSSGNIHWSEETFKIFEYDGAVKPSVELVFQRIHPADRDFVQQTLGRATNERAMLDFEHRLLMPDSSVKYLHVLAHASESPLGDLEYVGAVTDFTAAKRAEDALRRSESNLAEAQRLSHTGSYVGTPGPREISYWSEECYRVLGFDPQKGLPTIETFLQRVYPEDQATSIEEMERAAHEKTGFEFDYRIVHPGGEIRDIHTIGHPVFSPSGDLVEFVGTVIDVTERKRAEEERERLRQAQADLARVNRVTTMGELTASLAHEVNQPIAASVTNANTCIRWLAADVPNLEKARAAAERIVKDGTRAAEIISRIRLVFQKGSSQLELLDVNEVIEEMIVLLRGEATRYAISVRTELAADLPQVTGDRVQLQQVMMNLMINSIDAMKAVDGTRNLAIKSQRAENGQVLVSVTDNGVGLPPQQADQIFNAFFTTKSKGTGMGLRISRSIIESYGGRLWAADNSPRGATFQFTLRSTAAASANR
jgi:PAS domain S-box-containing protein